MNDVFHVKIILYINFTKINLEINTLEDTFINIGLDEERFLNKNH